MKNPALRRPCPSPGCTVRDTVGGRCDTHRRHAKRQSPGWHSLYGSDWPRIRLDYLERHPRCDLCPRMARTPDHYPVPLRRLLERGVTNPHHDRYLRPLCLSCHAKVTGHNQPGGWHAQRL